jgi:phospholipid/cholesterol/gamma-HCH transport system permease protein
VRARAGGAGAPARRVVVDAAAVDYCDGGGVAMLVDLLRQPRDPAAAVSVRGLRPEFQTLLNQFDPVRLAMPAAPAPARRSMVEVIGQAAATLGRDVRLGTRDHAPAGCALEGRVVHL